jgi:hypothetical protein
VSWLRLDSDYASDGTLRRCKAVQWWPLILCAMKRGGGVASDDDISPEVLADIGQGSEDAARLAVERLKASGKLIEVPGGWSTPGWSEHQPDPTASDRARRYRERNRAASDAADERASRCVTVTSRDETVRHGDVTAENGSSRQTGHTRQDIHTDHSEREAAVTTSRARADDPPTPPPPTRKPVGAVVEAFRATQSGREAMMVAPRTVQELGAMVDAHGEATVIEAIGRAADSCKPPLTLAYLRPVVEAVARGEPRGKPRVSTTSRHFDTNRRTEDFGPQPMPPGEI